jgi:sec-independent protein translocase protein TatA
MLGTQDLILILIVAVVIFGPKKLPEIAKGLGRAMREFKNATEGLKGNFQDEVRDLPTFKSGIMAEIDRPAELESPSKKDIDPEISSKTEVATSEVQSNIGEVKKDSRPEKGEETAVH